MSGGPISGPGASPTSQQLPDTKALEEADQTEIVRLKNGKFKVGSSKGSAFNRTVRKLLMPKTYQREAQKATQAQQSAAVDAVQNATGRKFPNVSLGDRQITVAQFRSLLNPPPPQVPDSVAAALAQPEAPGHPEVKIKAVYQALQDATAGLHTNNQYQEKEVVGGFNFANIKPPKHSAIELLVRNPDTNELNSAPFHANRVGSQFIATQGPKTEETSSNYKDHFYQMLYTEDTSTVVNLTNASDVARSKGKLARTYWPEQGQTAQHGDLLVKTSSWEKGKGFDVVTIQIGQEDNYSNELDSENSKEVKIYHFHAWPDHGIPEKEEDVEAFHRFTDAVEARGEFGRTTVHCRAGVGRTGVYIALDQLRQEAREGTLDRSNLMTRAAEVVWSGREDRGEALCRQKSSSASLSLKWRKN